ncbi:MAG: DUF935 domain-containing protein [Shimia sp.]
MALVDQYGRAMKRKELLAELGAPGLTGLRSIWSDGVASGLTPQRLAAILRDANNGEIEAYVTLAEEMEERDAHYASVLGVRKRRVSGIVPTVEPVSESARDREVAEAVERRITQHPGFADLVEDLLDAIGKGFSVVEIEWAASGSEWWPSAFKHRDARYFLPDPEDPEAIRLRDEDDPARGVPLAPAKWMFHRAKLKSGHWARGGLARVVAFGWICKAYTVKDWVAFVETFGLPIRLGRYGPSATREDVEVLFRAVANIGSDAAAVLPESMKIDFERATQGAGGGTDVFESLARWVDEQTSKAVLGQTMTADNGSSMAQAQVHNDVRLDIAAADARGLMGTLARDLVAPFVALNFGADVVPPKVRLEVAEPEDTAQLLERTTGLVAAGLRVKASEVRSRLGYSDPDDDDEVLGGPEAPAERPTAEARNREADEPSGSPDDVLDELLAGLEEGWVDVQPEMLGPLVEALEGTQGYREAVELLSPDRIPTAAFIGGLAEALLMARGIGDARDG